MGLSGTCNLQLTATAADCLLVITLFAVKRSSSRYLFALQVRRDLSTGDMPTQEHTAVLLASYIVQGDLEFFSHGCTRIILAEIGDFLEDEYMDHTYLSKMALLPQTNEELLCKIMEHHKEHM